MTVERAEVCGRREQPPTEALSYAELLNVIQTKECTHFVSELLQQSQQLVFSEGHVPGTVLPALHAFPY